MHPRSGQHLGSTHGLRRRTRVHEITLWVYQANQAWIRAQDSTWAASKALGNTMRMHEITLCKYQADQASVCAQSMHPQPGQHLGCFQLLAWKGARIYSRLPSTKQTEQKNTHLYGNMPFFTAK